MQKYRIWKNDNQEVGLLIKENKIEQAIDTGESVLIIRGVGLDMIDSLNEKYQEWVKTDDGYRIRFADHMAAFLEDVAGIEGATVEHADLFVEPEEVVAFHTEEQTFWNLADSYTTDIYRWWDGSNWRTEFYGEHVAETLCVTISDDYVNLDEWDGRNRVTGGMGHHTRVYRVIELDGEKPEEPTFLINYWSQWQGDHETAEIVALDELPAKLRELNRNPQEYIAEIENLSWE